MKSTTVKHIKNSVITVSVLTLFFAISLLIQYALGAPELVPAMFVVAVCFVSLLTDGYIYGIISALASVLAVNYAFTLPYFKFNFTMAENIVSAAIMITVTLITSTLTTKIRKQEAARAEALREKMRANLLRAVSHDLRTPLTSIYGATSTVTENYSTISDESKLALLCGVKEDSEWLIRMVENLLSVTKLNDGSVRLAKTPTVVDELIDSVLSKFHKRYPNETVNVSTPDDFLAVPMDAILIEQVLVNMLENSVQHAKGHTEINLYVSTDGGTVRFDVSDNGCGIEESILSEIFSGKLDRGDSTSHGMGIGLSVCASIVRAHDGEIYAKNLTNGGATLGFKLKTDEQ